MAVSVDDSASVSFAIEVAGPVLRVRVAGELDLSCAALFAGLFDLRATGVQTVVLDLAGLTFCDVTGVNALTGLAAYHRCQGRTVQVVHVPPQVRRVLTWTDAAVAARRGPVAG